jgi:penicillin-binding protein 1A
MAKPKRIKYKSSESSSPSLLRTLIKWVFVAGLWVGLFVVVVLAWYARELPSIIENPQFQPKASITVLDNEGEVIGRYGDIKGQSLSIQDMPKHLIDAILSIEDRRFYYHFGIDPIGLLRAFVVNTVSGDVRQGGSTITQQLAKNLFLSHERTYKRKIQEALLALWLEHELTKDEILAAYLNRVYMGAGTYGVDAASKVYFKKSARDLTIKESAMLAGLLRAPSRYSPSSNYKASIERAKVVVGAMVDAGHLTKDEAAQVFKKKSKTPTSYTSEGESARYYADWVVDQVSDLIGTPEGDIVVETTMDSDIQINAAKVIADAVEKNRAKSNVSQGATVVMRPDGSVVAMVGGIDYRKSQFNRAGQGMRQPGSSFKPIVYLAALESGYSAGSVVNDAPMSYGSYTPQNYGGKYYGEITLTGALTLSLNSVAVQLASNVGVNHVINTARRLGITSNLEPNLSLALGSNEIPMLEMASAYTTISNGGFLVKAYGIKTIRTEDGKKLYEYKQKESPRNFRGSDIGQLTAMMQSVVQHGTGMGAAGPFFAAGKTGTSQDFRDAWFDGFTDDYTAIVWFGNDNNTPMKGVTGGAISARAWRDIITAAKADPTPSQYAISRSYDITDEFTDMLSRLTSDGAPITGADGQPLDLTNPENGNALNWQIKPTFTPDRDGDKVGYDRLN